MNIIEFNKISKKFGKIKVLHECSFGIKEGKIIGILGSNGSGKTTIMRLLVGLINPTSGFIVKKKNIQIKSIIEEPQFYNHLNSFHNLAYLTADIYGVKKKQIIDVVKFLNMESYAKKRVGRYSLGMKQRLGIAYLLLGNADVLVLDEPTNGLDPLAIVEIRNLFKKIVKERKMTIFISSHSLQEMQMLCDEIIFIKDGIISGFYDLTLLNNELGYIIKMKTEKECNNAIEELSGRFLYKIVGNTSFKLNVSEDNISAVIKELSLKDLNIIEAVKVQNNLEEIYLNIMGNTNDKS